MLALHLFDRQMETFRMFHYTARRALCSLRCITMPYPNEAAVVK